jgi:hypothetical protein
MKETGILFTPDNIRAIREGRKTQTRRVMKGVALEILNNGFTPKYIVDPGNSAWNSYGVPGDRLYIKEGWQTGKNLDDKNGTEIAKMCLDAGYKTPVCPLRYRSDGTIIKWGEADLLDFGEWGRYRSSRFMPKWAARIWLELTEVRVERVQDISEEDAAAEGCESLESEREEYDWKICPRCGGTRLYEYQSMAGACPDTDCTECDTYKKRYRYLWDSINAKKHSWASNPWVWALTFKVLPAEGRAGAWRGRR